MLSEEPVGRATTCASTFNPSVNLNCCNRLSESAKGVSRGSCEARRELRNETHRNRPGALRALP
jgi:hypothetical protein